MDQGRSILAVTIQLDAALEAQLRREVGDLDQVAKEATLVDLFRQGKLSHFELTQALGVDRFETNAILNKHGVHEGSLTLEDLEEQRLTLDRVLGPVRR